MAIYYIDKNRGSDSNDGLSTAAPWKELTKMDDAAKAAGDMVLLADDSVWDYDLATRVMIPSTWAGTQYNPVTIGKYSPLSAGTGKPTIRRNNIIAENEWVYSAPDNAWYYDAPNLLDPKSLVRINASWLASMTDGGLPLASVDGRYKAGDSRLYMYAPAGTNPTAYYGEVLLSDQRGTIALSSNSGCVDVEDLYFENTGTGVSLYSAVATPARFNVRRVDGRTVAGLVIANSASPGQLYATISGCNITDWGSTAISAYSVGGAGIAQLSISRNTITDGMHGYSQGGIYLQTRGSGLVTRVFENHISTVRYGTLGKAQDGCAIYTETGSDNVEVFRNVVHNAAVALQDNSGRKTTWYANLVYDCHTAMKASDQAGNNAVDHTFVGNTCIVGVDKSDLTSFGSQDSGIGWRCYKDAGTISNMTVRNNVFVNTAETPLAAIITPQITPAASDYTYNSAYNYPQVARREYTPFTVETSTGSIATDPLLTSDYKPTPFSPLLGAGVHLGYTRDRERKQRPNPPSIGAYDVATLRAV